MARAKVPTTSLCLCLVIALAALQVVIFLMWREINTKSIPHKAKYNPRKIQVVTRDPNISIWEPCPQEAELHLSPGAVMLQMDNHWQAPEYWDWIRNRMNTLWDDWVAAIRKIQNIGQWTGRRRLKILVVPGVLRATTMANPEKIQSGGPLGDLLQWADLISGLVLLGHHVIILDDFYQAGRWLRYDWLPSDLEQEGCVGRAFDLIYADIITMKTFQEDILEKYRCRFRVIDAYGTEAMFNDKKYAKTQGIAVGGPYDYGGLGLNLKQFLTFYPHTPDNSFLGFAVVPPKEKLGNKRESMGILYGKDPEYFIGKEAYLETLLKRLELHSTLANSSVLPEHDGIVNHGILSSREYKKLLQGAKFFIGVGLPLESTAVLEALAHGCVFLNPRFHGNQTSRLQYEGKPTSRQMSSQVPYLEKYVGPPNVYTLDIDNADEVLKTIMDAMPHRISPVTPYEFTMAGFLLRLKVYLDNQDFCHLDLDNQWPPLSSMTFAVSKINQSCIQLCQKRGLVCEPAGFHEINVPRRFKSKKLFCSNILSRAHIVYPAFSRNTSTCYLQSEPQLFSCAGSHPGLKRLCPCRDTQHEQIALCKECS